MDFTDIKGRIAQYINRDELVPLIEDWVNQALRKIQRNFNFKCMEERETLSTGSAYLIVPTGYKEAIWLQIQKPSGAYKTLLKSFPNEAMRQYPDMTLDTGEPEMWFNSYGLDSLVIRPTPDQTYLFDVYFYKFLDPLSSTNLTNWFTENNPELLLYGALNEASAYIPEDSRSVLWSQKFSEAFKEAVSNEKAESLSGSYQSIRTII